MGPTPFSPVGLRVVQPQAPLHASELYLEGLYQIQDEASQLIAYLLDPHPGERVLDLCAGFGGKTTHLAQVMKNQGTILASRLQLPEDPGFNGKMPVRLGLRNIRVQTGDFLQP